jgi:hypothetical protein
MNKFAATIRHEFEEMIPPTVYFFIVFHLVAAIRVLLNKDDGIDVSTTVSLAVAALILGKAVLIANHLPFINRFPEKPLIWNVSWKTMIYVLLAVLLHYLERLFEAWKITKSIAAATEKLLAETFWPHFWAIQILLTVLVVVYCVISEVDRALGEKRLKKMFFGPMPRKPTAGTAH